MIFSLTDMSNSSVSSPQTPSSGSSVQAPSDYASFDALDAASSPASPSQSLHDPAASYIMERYPEQESSRRLSCIVETYAEYQGKRYCYGCWMTSEEKSRYTFTTIHLRETRIAYSGVWCKSCGESLYLIFLPRCCISCNTV